MCHIWSDIVVLPAEESPQIILRWLHAEYKFHLLVREGERRNNISMEQQINFSTITACGECCVDCKKKLDGLCKGCIESDGCVPEWASSGRCKVHACARDHGVQFCGICKEFPCDELVNTIHWNPDIVGHLSGLAKQYQEQAAGESQN